MTPACRLLKQHKIPYSIHDYEHDPDNSHFGEEAVSKLGLSADEVFKTLLVTDGRTYFVAVLPVAQLLNLKKCANALGVKKVTMATLADAERVTGYVAGGISPVAQKKHLTTLIADQANALSTIYVSGGKRGLSLGIHPAQLAMLLDAAFADITD